METTYRCNVALNGELGSVVHKEGVSAPEIKILLHLHGLGSVTNIAMYGKEDIDSTDERVRLGNMYQEERVHEVFGNFGPLPLDIKELKLDINLFEKGTAPIGLGGAKVKKQPTGNNGTEHNTASPAE
tara:strand:- start:1093 stop:1476 length:384 start_codon:yes stop_codon:yes gene_type:complete